MITSKASIQSPNAARYLTRLCRHFSHKVTAEWDDTRGRVEFAMGTCFFEASGNSLNLTTEAATQEDTEKVQEIIGSHLVRFAAAMKDAEELTVTWQ
ncbi:MAG TPA: DUF2218 domain-containing protein [Marinobacter sp.]|nr:DUF2218 domain-containing protein [Marinobacter sp.]